MKYKYIYIFTYNGLTLDLPSPGERVRSTMERACPEDAFSYHRVPATLHVVPMQCRSRKSSLAQAHFLLKNILMLVLAAIKGIINKAYSRYTRFNRRP